MIPKVKCFSATWCKWKLVIAPKAEPQGKSSWRRLPSHIYVQNCSPFLKHLSVAVAELNRQLIGGRSFSLLLVSHFISHWDPYEHFLALVL